MLLIDELDKVDQGFEPDASTNLFIWTTSERLNYELEPAGAVAPWALRSIRFPFLSLVERPGLLRADAGWLLEAGKPAAMAAICG